MYIAIQLQNGEKQEFQISSYRTGVNLPDAVFRFDKANIRKRKSLIYDDIIRGIENRTLS